MKKIFKQPLFILGLAIRVILIATVLPQAATQWYLPFLTITSQHLSWNPWQVFLSMGGLETAFPYGYVMWLVFLPLIWICHLLAMPAYFAYAGTLLIVDICLLLILKKIFQTQDRVLLIAYWLSPIVLFATYWLGLNDLIPVMLLCLALYFTRKLKLTYAGLLCGAAISAKLSMVLVVPFFCIYLYRNPPLRRLFSFYIMGLATALLLFCLPFVFSSAGLKMLVYNPEMNKVYQFILQIGPNATVYLLPMIYLLMLYLTWWIRRMSFDLLNILLGLSFFFVVLLTPAAPGWFIWLIPLLVFYQISSGRVAVFLVSIFTSLYIINSFLTTPASLILGNDYAGQFVLFLHGALGEKGLVILYTILLSLGIVIMVRIWFEAVRSNNYFRLSRKPFIIGIAGDSGAGKDTLAHSLQGLFGKHSVTHLSGDNYHLWDRHKPMWQVMTHLNPRANDLEQYTHDLLSLSKRKAIMARRYDHEAGKMTCLHQIKSNDFVIASGLHTLYLPLLRNSFDLSIYLDINEDLRRYFKIHRDVYVRGHSKEQVVAALDKREEDAKKFIHPQMKYADLVISLQPLNSEMLQENNSPDSLRYKLIVNYQHRLKEEALIKILVGICGVHVDMSTSDDDGRVQLTIEGDVSAEDIALAAAILFPHINEFLDIAPLWQNGVQGLIQLIVLSHVDLAMRKRLL